MKHHISRRRFVQLVTASVAGAVAPFLNAKSQVTALENCYWQKMRGPYCRNGVLYEDWCWRCCASIDCWYEFCETRPIGSC